MIGASKGVQRTKPNKQEMKNMKQNNWNENANNVREWLETLEESRTTKAIDLSLMLGDDAKTDDERTSFWSAIRSIGGKMEGFPAARRGNQPAYSEVTLGIFALAVKMVTTAYAAIPTNLQSQMIAVFFPHGRTGGSYANFQDFVKGKVNEMNRNLTDAIKENRWNGVKVDKNGMPVIEPKMTKAEKDALKAAEEAGEEE
tara:strand:- start:3709 stop:4308 length:600 start_codon:yes stop_codon:yes gene_type:complete